MCVYKCFRQTEYWGAQSRGQNFTGQKWTILNRYISVITDIGEKWFVIFEHTINWISFSYVHLPQLEYYFSFFFLFSYFFFFFNILLRLSTFKPLNALYSKFERLKISGRTSARLKLGVPGWGTPSNGSSKILNFLSVGARQIKFSEWVDIRNKLNLTKIEGATMGGFPPNEPSRIQTFYPFKLDAWNV